MANKEEKNNFSLEIMQFANTSGLSYMEAITEWCDIRGMEVELAATMVNDVLKDLIQVEATKLRYLPKINTLPL